ncbi:SNF2 family N-terminal domain-containing protein [Sordaria brevicollis]|uniref:SNF2 family N-terminal domain-containing protein n=1 Tax=Sordaria brevicollis TaxID=83679 RepID=A0AAE0PB70_SORBR|nr:SNF2 family N-terminal domain-containing protein [Sordaria brevicollis]
MQAAMTPDVPETKRRFSEAFGEGNANRNPTKICYGALYDVKAQCLDGCKAIETQPHLTTIHGSFISFAVTRTGGFFCLSSEEGAAIAVVDRRTQTWLSAISHIPDVKFQALLTAGIVSKRKKRFKKDVVLDGLSVNVFGPSNKAVEDDVADKLDKVSAYLQHPRALSQEIQYSNPQWSALSSHLDDRDMNDWVGTYINDDSSWAVRARIASEINGILDSLDDVPSEETLQFVSPPGLTSELKRHQIQAILFILTREPGNCFFRTSNAGIRTSMPSSLQELPGQSNHGGLIADVMGMGKSLTILTTILSTLEHARNFPHFSFQSQNVADVGPKTLTQATLVVVPSAQLMHNWAAEIKSHMPGALKLVLFHGQSRAKSREPLTSTDVVLTTYGTLAADHKKAGLLQAMEWYRVVLDEAHWIRNPSSQQYRAATSLSTSRRWCLTGTPIQNKLDDLASLAHFLRVSPYSDKNVFRKHVLEPLENGDRGCADPLRLYLRRNCLRRTGKCLNLPKLQEETVGLQLSGDEQKAYETILSTARRALDDIVSSADKTKKSKNEKMTVLFTALTKLRRLCDLGTLPPIVSVPGNTGQSPEDSDILCELCSSGDLDRSLMLKDEQFCPDCSRPLRSQNPAKNTGYLTPACLPDIANDRAMSPLVLSMNDGHSTKLLKVRDNVVQVLQDQPDTKHLIFSAWTSSLVYLGQLMQQAGIPHAQISGRTSNAERSKHIKAFQENSQVPVLLMSIGTGAVGLTLTAASHVHIIEPQWNPSVEDQAIGRAHRMGQTKEVVVTRYIITRSVERSILSLQQRKKNIARFTFDAAGGDALSERLEDFKLVLNAT